MWIIIWRITDSDIIVKVASIFQNVSIWREKRETSGVNNRYTCFYMCYEPYLLSFLIYYISLLIPLKMQVNTNQSRFLKIQFVSTITYTMIMFV